MNEEQNIEQLFEEDIKEEEIDNTLALIKFACDIKQFETSRIHRKYENMCVMFVNLRLLYLITSQCWRYNVYNSAISDMSIVTDETLAILLLENHINEFDNMIDLNRKLTREESKPR